MNEYQRRYRASEKGKATARESHRRYRATKKGRAVAKASQLKIKYGLTIEGLREMLAAQSGQCAICLVAINEETAAVDHDRRCCSGRKTCGRCIRGLLCKNCNAGIGLLGDDRAALERAAAYVKRETGEVLLEAVA